METAFFLFLASAVFFALLWHDEPSPRRVAIARAKRQATASERNQIAQPRLTHA